MTTPIRFCLLTLALLLLSTFEGNAQKKSKLEPPKVISTVSEDNRFFAVNYSIKRFVGDGFLYLNSTKIYHVKSRKYIAKINYGSTYEYEWLEFSPDAQKLVAKSGKDMLLLDIPTMSLQKKFENAATIGFINACQEVVVQSGLSIQAYDLSNNKPTKTYSGLLKGDVASELLESPDGRYIMAKLKQHYALWLRSSYTNPERILASDLRIVENGQKAVAVSYQSRYCAAKVYQLPTWKVIREFDSNKYKHFSDYTYTEGSSVSPDGKFVVFCAKQFGLTVGVGIFDTQTGKKVAEVDSMKCNFEVSVQPYYWRGAHGLGFRAEKDAAFAMDLPNTTLREGNIQTKSKAGTPSPNVLWFAQYDNRSMGSFVTIIRHLPKGTETRLPGVRFLAFSHDDETVFLEKPDRTFGFMLLADVLAGKPTYFAFSNKPFRPGTEGAVSADAPEPAGYKHQFLKGTKPWEERSSGDKPFPVLKTIAVTGDTVALEMNLLDSKGLHYTGAKLPDWQKMWCKAELKKEGKIIPFKPEDIFVTETQASHKNIMLGLVMDHSGSMGETRAYAIQAAADSLIHSKKPLDTIAVIKYDSKVEVEVRPEANMEMLTSKLQYNGLEGYGRSTALIDACYEAVILLAKTPAAQKTEKAVVLFTDGIENSSVGTLNELLLKATEHRIKIHTIGFGAKVDEDFMKKLAESTGGAYYRIYKTSDFTPIFKDVYQKMHLYYAMKFKVPPGKGDYSLMLQPCDGKAIQMGFRSGGIEEERPIEIIDESGDPFEEVPELGDIRLLNVQFKYNSAEVVPPTDQEVEKAVQFLKKYPRVTIELRGHTDDTGSDESNQELSQKRADKIKAMLVAKGISENRIAAVGYGEAMPIADNSTNEGRGQNRRTEFVILGK